MVEVLVLDDRNDAFKEYPRMRGSLDEALKRGSVIAVGKPQDLIKLAREAESSFWYRLFLCQPGCPEEVVETLAKLADAWEVYYSIRFVKPQGKVTRREALQSLIKRGMKGRLVALPENTFACASPLCDQCKLVCPANAIRLKEKRIAIDPDKCVSCGLCVAVCPLYSLDMPGLAPNELLAAVPPSKAEVAKKVVMKKPRDLSENDFEEGTLVLLSVPVRVNIIVEYFTKVLGWEYCDAKGCVMPNKVEPKPCDVKPKEEVSPLFTIKVAYSLDTKYEVFVDERLCDTCTVCSEVCPTGALVLRSPTLTVSMLSHLPAACVGCNACVRACPVQRKLNALGLNIKMIRVVEADEAECIWKNLVVKKAFKPQCAFCGKPLKVDPEVYLKKIEEFLINKVEKGEFEEVYTPESFLEKADDLVRLMLCEQCYSKYKKKELPAVTVAKMVLLMLGCVYEQEVTEVRWPDPVKALWKLAAQMDIEGFNYCAELTTYRSLYSGGLKESRI